MGSLTDIGKAKAAKAAKAKEDKKKTSGGKPNGKQKKQDAKSAAAAQAIAGLKNKAEMAKDPEVAISALNAIEEIRLNWGKWVESKATQKKVGFECKEKLEADEAALKAAMEEALPAGNIQEHANEAIQKLENIEQRWQEYCETKEANTEHRKAAKERVAMYLDKLERALTESAQLTLPHVG